MEKYSAFRDPGTGIQPFLTPVPPGGSEVLAKILLPFGCVIGGLRAALISVLVFAYVTFVRVCLVLVPVPPLYRVVTGLLITIISRFVLLLVGVWWIPVELVTRKRRRAVQSNESWSPQAGDVIVSNWVSWIEILWLAFRFNPIFVLPVCEAVDIPVQSPRAHITHTRRTGTGSAALSSPNRTPSTHKTVTGFQIASLLSIISATGHVPPHSSNMSSCTFEEIRRAADRPVVVFPECTTSNGRGMLRFADIFKDYSVPVKGFKVFIMCVRYDPPTNLSPTLSHSIPSLSLNPVPHILKLTTALRPQPVSIRLLSPSESPSSQLFMVSEVISATNGEDVLSEICAALISQIGKVKRTGMGWEDKVAFLDFYRSKK